MKSIIGIFFRLFNYLKEARQEVKKVNWPTGPEVMQKTIVVVVFSAIVTGILGGFDVLFNKGMLKLFETQGARQEEVLSSEALDTSAVDMGVNDNDGNSVPVEVVGGDKGIDGLPDEPSAENVVE